MNGATIVCPNCKKSFEISDAIQHQIKDELLKAKTEQSETLRKEYDDLAESKIKEAVQAAVVKAQQASELQLARERQNAKLELEKAKQLTELEVEKAKSATGLETERLRREAASSKESEKELRKQLTELLEELSKANKARENAELEARKELLEKEKVIREDAAQKASDDFNTKIREQEETINRLREQLTTAKQVAEQGSQQLQGEILELDVEQNLRNSFPLDGIEEVKKGERGSDIRQVVNEAVNEKLYQDCGLILWECKNAKTYQERWLEKLKGELVTEKAQIGVIVFNPADGRGEECERLTENIWLVKPRYVSLLAALLREILVKVFVANRNAEGKDAKVEMIYKYLTGGEFSNRIRYVLDAYSEMAKELDKEKKQTQKRWAAQEKIIQKVNSSLYQMSGDFQGIAGQDIVALPDAMGDSDEEIQPAQLGAYHS